MSQNKFKRFHVRVQLQLHALTCPGVWLCSHGYLEVTIKALSYYFRTGAMEPTFPMLCHDKFVMEGFVKSVTSVEHMEHLLEAEQLEITLWQNGRRLAYFVGNLGDVMHPTVPRLSCEHNSNVQLLMKATSAFPGIIAPKVELSAQLTSRDRVQLSTNLSTQSFVGTHHTHFEQLRKFKPNVERGEPAHSNIDCGTSSCQRRQQQTVCHARQSSCRSKINFSYGCSPPLLRRLSTCSSLLSNNSQAISSQESTTTRPDYSNSSCLGADIVCNESEEHQRSCDICQTYSRTFSKYNN